MLQRVLKSIVFRGADSLGWVAKFRQMESELARLRSGAAQIAGLESQLAEYQALHDSAIALLKARSEQQLAEICALTAQVQNILNLPAGSPASNVLETLRREFSRLGVETSASADPAQLLHSLADALQAFNDRRDDPLSSFDETAASRAYTFDELVERRVILTRLPLVFHVHIPKAAGNTISVLFRQNKYWQIDIAGDNFFHYITPAAWRDLYLGGRACVFSGHFRLSHPLLKRVGQPYATVALLRHPVERLLSAYNAALRLDSAPWHSDIVSGAMSFVEYAETFSRAVGTQFGYFAETAGDSVETCLDNLLTKVTFYGFSEHLDETSVALGYLLGLSNVLTVPPDNVTDLLANPAGRVSKRSCDESELEALNRILKDELWFYDSALSEYRRRMKDARLDVLLEQSHEMAGAARDLQERFMRMEDPLRPGEKAFRNLR